MKKVLLRVSGMRPEMRRGKVLKPFGTDAAARKIKLAQRAFHPHVHRERAIETVGEQQHAVGNFVPDTAQFHQLLARFRLRQMAQAFRSNLPSAIFRAAASRCGARNPILQARSSASVAAAMRCGVGNEWSR